MRDRTLHVSGLQTKIIESGSGPAVLLLHGGTLGLTSESWRTCISPLASLGYRVIAFDQPGFGFTDPPEDFSINFRVSFIREVMHAMDIPRGFVVGHSLGGVLAVQGALEYPDRLHGVVAIGTGSLLPPSGHTAREALPSNEPSLADTRRMLLDNLYHTELISDALVSSMNSLSIGKNYRNALRRVEAAATQLPEERPLWTRLEEVSVPQLFVYGADDKPNTVARVSEAKQKYPKLRLNLLPQCGHLVQYDRRDEVVRLLDEFFGACLRNKP